MKIFFMLSLIAITILSVACSNDTTSSSGGTITTTDLTFTDVLTLASLCNDIQFVPDENDSSKAIEDIMTPHDITTAEFIAAIKIAVENRFDNIIANVTYTPTVAFPETGNIRADINETTFNVEFIAKPNFQLADDVPDLTLTVWEIKPLGSKELARSRVYVRIDADRDINNNDGLLGTLGNEDITIRANGVSTTHITMGAADRVNLYIPKDNVANSIQSGFAQFIVTGGGNLIATVEAADVVGRKKGNETTVTVTLRGKQDYTIECGDVVVNMVVTAASTDRLSNNPLF